jgi:hypothetical protein
MTMTMEYNPQHDEMTDGQHALRGCPSFETLCLYFDRELAPADIESLSGHIESCEHCTAALRDIQLIRQGLRMTSPATRQISIRLTEADVEGERPVVRVLEPVPTVTPMQRPSRFTIPFAPAVAAIAALFLIAVLIGDFATRDDTGGNPPGQIAQDETAVERPTVSFGGTAFVPSDEDYDQNVGAAGSDVMNPDDTNEPSQAPAQQGGDNGFWNWWRAAEILLIALLAGLLATIYLQRRSPRA